MSITRVCHREPACSWLQEAAPAHLSDLLGTVDAAKRRIILQRMAVQLVPLMEKALVDPTLAHRQAPALSEHCTDPGCDPLEGLAPIVTGNQILVMSSPVSGQAGAVAG